MKTSASFSLPSLSILLGLVALLSCHKDISPQLPAATQVGKRTFGCKVNGRVFIPGGNQAIFQAPLTLTFEDNIFDLRANYNRSEEYVGIFRTNVLREGDYDLTQKISVLYYWNDAFPSGCTKYYTDLSSPNATILSGKLTITRLSLVGNGLVAGQFAFVLVSPQCDTVRVTEGRFDMPLQ